MSGTGPSVGPTDWVSGERVFAPPNGTVDVDWLVPAVLEAEPSADPQSARAALAAAWAARRTGEPAPRGDRLADVAARVVEEASAMFGTGGPTDVEPGP